MAFRKIINDPVYGFITLNDELVKDIIAHPVYQRLRRINQMALASFVYPGAVHTRLHHSLGAYHLMCNALSELINKGVSISPEECLGAKIAILLHDIGHGPFSHALENVLAQGMHHEDLSVLIMQDLNRQFDNKLDIAIAIFTDQYPKKFLHQLVSGQLDVDRLDYLMRDSFFSGVSEGVVGYDRILKMLTVHDGQLMVEEKGIHSIEKFLVARRLMYSQVYLHKTVLSAEQMLKRIIYRARKIGAQCAQPLNDFVNQPLEKLTLDGFCSIDDCDVMMAIKGWCSHPDKILSLLCNGIINRRLYKVKYFSDPVDDAVTQTHWQRTKQAYQLTDEETGWLVFTGEAMSNTYNFGQENIHILFKDGTVKDISEVDDALIHKNLNGNIKKYYICYLN